MSLRKIQAELRALTDEDQAKHLLRFFKTGPGQYGYGDKFRGIKVPPVRALVKKYSDTIELNDAVKLLQSSYHEDRLCALLIMVKKFERSQSQSDRKNIYQSYIANIKNINNWDLVDLSCYHIVGGYLADKSRKDLYKFARAGRGSSDTVEYQYYDLWSNRIAIVSTMHFIRDNDFADTFAIADELMDNKHDLIHKAVGWMLREAGKRDQLAEEKYLKSRYKTMPRTMLRYAIERFDETKRQQYLKK